MLDLVFTSGIVIGPDGKTELYAGLGDCMEGRLVIDYPFEAEGPIVSTSMGLTNAKN
jgi:hypothetical protein